jgi:hypothetical protein
MRKLRRTKAFSSEAVYGSREENASKHKESKPLPIRFNRIGKGFEPAV